MNIAELKGKNGELASFFVVFLFQFSLMAWRKLNVEKERERVNFINNFRPPKQTIIGQSK